MMTEIRKSYIDARNSVRKLDKSLHLVQFLDSVTSIMDLMINIFMMTNRDKMPYYETYLRTVCWERYVGNSDKCHQISDHLFVWFGLWSERKIILTFR